MNKKLIYSLFFTILVFVDRASKWFAINYLVDSDVFLLPSTNLTLGFNRGISLGMFHSDSTWVFILIFLGIAGILTIFSFYTLAEYRSGKNIIPELLILVGGFSNLLDRLLYGGVIDFVDFYIGDYHWYTLNIADVYIVIGILIILARSIHEYYRAD